MTQQSTKQQMRQNLTQYTSTLHPSHLTNNQITHIQPIIIHSQANKQRIRSVIVTLCHAQSDSWNANLTKESTTSSKMDLSMSEDFESSLLNWEEVGQQQQRPESEGMGSGTTSGSQTPLDGGQKQQPLTTQAMKEGFSRLPSFPTSIGGYPVTSEPQQSNTDAHGLAMTAER